jgi:hypothetical protein
MTAMNQHADRQRGPLRALFLGLSLLLGAGAARAGDAAQLLGVTVPDGTTFMPRTIFTQTWTFQNTGTTTWSPTRSGYTLNLLGKDSLGAVPFAPRTSGHAYTTTTAMDSSTSVSPGGQASFRMSLIAPETAGTYTDTFQLNSANSVFFGPQVTVQITVPQAGSTNQYDRARAVSYANNYAGYVCSDGYFWTNGSSFGFFGALAPVPTSVIGDDCAHFVSCCIGSQANGWGGGLTIPGRVPPTYGEPGAGRLVSTVLIGGGWATEVSSLSSLLPGDVVGWNWEGNTNMASLDHVTFYLGNGLLASHAASCLEVSATTWYQSSEPNYVRHLIHIFDAPTLAATHSGSNLVLSWGTNWAGYALYSSSSLAPSATWTKASKSPTVVGKLNMLTNTLPGGAQFFRLMHP